MANLITGTSAAETLSGTAEDDTINGTASTLYRFVSSGADAAVSASELTALATLTGAPSLALDDFIFAGVSST